MVGRWKSGAPIINAPTQDDPTMADGTAIVNAFEFDGDREGLKCPWAAHVRKAYPRNDVPGNTSPTQQQSDNAESETQTHRLMRRGIAFGPEVTEEEAMSGTSAGGDRTRGLLFMCYQTSLDNQFEFVQQSWADTVDFTQPGSGIDPIIGQSANSTRPFLGAAPFSGQAANKPSMQLRSFVHMQGGAYFFAPSINELKAI
jgi:Dyp-type peroxidase family